MFFLFVLSIFTFFREKVQKKFFKKNVFIDSRYSKFRLSLEKGKLFFSIPDSESINTFTLIYTEGQVKILSAEKDKYICSTKTNELEICDRRENILLFSLKKTVDGDQLKWRNKCLIKGNKIYKDEIVKYSVQLGQCKEKSYLYITNLKYGEGIDEHFIWNFHKNYKYLPRNVPYLDEE